ncbi:MAG: hypothetical protein GVY12_00435 [Bacteroidetes bacterium]|jgi:hypothetical protein|nr:hypothetical protein [Bacteroidota bacterium]
MDRYPTPGDYQEALQVPEVAFTDADLQQATPEVNTLGLPRAITGAFAAVFPMHRDGQRWAVKCFLTDVEDQRTRYRAVATHLHEADLPYTVPFDYQPQGIRVEGRVLPIVKMAWAPGTSLYAFVDDHRDDPEVLRTLAGRWAAMLQELRAANIAHGDLQHGNVLVSRRDGALRLQIVDYDTMWVPALQGRTSPEVGHRNYQHPDRSEQDFGPYLDHFAGLAVYTGLLACAERPSLWSRFTTGENLLFRASDFYDPSRSALLDELEDLEPLGALPDVLRTACYLEPEAVPPLADVLAGETGSAVRAGVGRARRTLSDTLEREARSRTTRNVTAPWFLPVALAVVAGAIGLAWAVTPLTGVALAVLGLVGLGGWVAYAFRRLPSEKRRRRLHQELAYFDRLLATYRDEIVQLKQQRQDILASVEERRADELAERQHEALYDKLKYHFIDEARQIEGISHKVIVRLKADGIRTAYDLSPDRLRHLHHVGDESTARLMLWRRSLEAQYAEAIPDALSPAEGRRFDRMIQKRVTHLEEEVQRLQEKRTVQQEARAEVTDRLSSHGTYPWHAFVKHLLRLGPPPPSVRGQPSRPTAPPADDAHVEGESDRGGPAPASVTAPDDPDAPWWEQHRAS